MFEVKISFSEEAKSLLTGFLAVFDLMQDRLAPTVTTELTSDPVSPAPAPVSLAPAPVPAPVAPVSPAPAPAVTIEDIRPLVVKLSASGKKAEAREIVKEYAASVSDIPAGKYAEVWARLQALEG